MNNIKTLEVGQKLYRSNRWNEWYSIVEVVRVTKTQAILDNGTRLKRDCSRYLEEVGRDSFSRESRIHTKTTAHLVDRAHNIKKR